MDTLNQILSSPAIGAISLFISAIGVIASIYFYRKSKREKKPCWAIRTNVLIEGYGSKLTDLKVMYMEHRVETLSVSRVMFWNEGTEIINQTDFTTLYPLKIVSKADTKILDSTLLRMNNPTNLFTVSPPRDEKECLMNFEYLAQDQGVIIQIVHTGHSSDDLAVEGAIKGVRILRRKKFRRIRSQLIAIPIPFFSNSRESTRRKVAAASYVLIGVIYGIVAPVTAILPFPTGQVSRQTTILSPIILQTVTRIEYRPMSTTSILLIIIFSVIIVMYTIYSAVKIMRQVPPQGLEDFLEAFMT